MAHAAPASAEKPIRRIPTPEEGRDLAHVQSDSLLDTIVVNEIPVTPASIREMQRWTKKHWFWSAADLGRRLGCSRAQVKRLESGSRQSSEMFLVHFHSLRVQRAAWQVEQADEQKHVHIVESTRPLPHRYRVFRPIVKCRVRGCHNWFEQINKRHRKCSPDCKPPKRKKKAKSK